jgi:hypothetical protein
MSPLAESLRAAASLLPGEFRRDHARLFEGEHLDRLAARLLALWRDGVPASAPSPHFAAECTPPLADAFAPFRPALAAWEAARDPLPPAVAQAFAEAIRSAGCDNLLVLLGQRRTAASLADVRAVPPSHAELLAAAARVHNPADGLSVAARALAKHAARSPGGFWGDPGGPVADRNRAARGVLDRILDGAAWWNVFGHHVHGTVFEARVRSGHGARWADGGRAFIGFLEPFADEDPV